MKEIALCLSNKIFRCAVISLVEKGKKGPNICQLPLLPATYIL